MHSVVTRDPKELPKSTNFASQPLPSPQKLALLPECLSEPGYRVVQSFRSCFWPPRSLDIIMKIDCNNLSSSFRGAEVDPVNSQAAPHCKGRALGPG